MIKIEIEELGKKIRNELQIIENFLRMRGKDTDIVATGHLKGIETYSQTFQENIDHINIKIANHKEILKNLVDTYLKDIE